MALATATMQAMVGAANKDILQCKSLMKHDLVAVIAYGSLPKVEFMEETAMVMAAATVEVIKGSKWRNLASEIPVHLPKTE